MKPNSVGTPDIYFGAKVKPMQLNNGVWAWGISPSRYVRESENCKDYLTKQIPPQYMLPKLATNPFLTNHNTGIDTSFELDPDLASYFQSLIRIIHWMVKLGCINVAMEASLLSSHSTLPHKGHTHAALHIMDYLGLQHNSQLYMEQTYPHIDN